MATSPSSGNRAVSTRINASILVISAKIRSRLSRDRQKRAHPQIPGAIWPVVPASGPTPKAPAPPSKQKNAKARGQAAACAPAQRIFRKTTRIYGEISAEGAGRITAAARLCALPENGFQFQHLSLVAAPSRYGWRSRQAQPPPASMIAHTPRTRDRRLWSQRDGRLIQQPKADAPSPNSRAGPAAASARRQVRKPDGRAARQGFSGQRLIHRARAHRPRPAQKARVLSATTSRVDFQPVRMGRIGNQHPPRAEMLTAQRRFAGPQWWRKSVVLRWPFAPAQHQTSACAQRKADPSNKGNARHGPQTHRGDAQFPYHHPLSQQGPSRKGEAPRVISRLDSPCGGCCGKSATKAARPPPDWPPATPPSDLIIAAGCAMSAASRRTESHPARRHGAEWRGYRLTGRAAASLIQGARGHPCGAPHWPPGSPTPLRVKACRGPGPRRARRRPTQSIHVPRCRVPRATMSSGLTHPIKIARLVGGAAISGA